MKPRERLGGASQGFPAACLRWPRGCGPLAWCSWVEATRRGRWVWSLDQGSGGSRGRIPARCGRCPIARAPAAPWAPGALSPAERTAPAPGGRAWRFPEVPGQQHSPAAHPGSRDCLGAAGGGDTEKEREAAAVAQPAGARSAGGGARGWVAAGECARPAGELRGGGSAPRAPRLASRSQLAPLLHRHTPTERHRAPAAPAGSRRASGSGIQTQVQGWLGAQSTAWFFSLLTPALSDLGGGGGGRGMGAPRGEKGWRSRKIIVLFKGCLRFLPMSLLWAFLLETVNRSEGCKERRKAARSFSQRGRPSSRWRGGGFPETHHWRKDLCRRGALRGSGDSHLPLWHRSQNCWPSGARVCGS